MVSISSWTRLLRSSLMTSPLRLVLYHQEPRRGPRRPPPMPPPEPIAPASRRSNRAAAAFRRRAAGAASEAGGGSARGEGQLALGWLGSAEPGLGETGRPRAVGGERQWRGHRLAGLRGGQPAHP